MAALGNEVRAPRRRPAGCGPIAVVLLLVALVMPLGCVVKPRPAVPSDMVQVPAGGFAMGSSDAQIDVAASMCEREALRPRETVCQAEAFNDEWPVHRVDLPGFLIDQHEVTATAYARCVEAGACTTPGTAVYCTWKVRKTARLPINCVTWTQAQAYCAWLGKRLPTEAEWERAARGTDARPFPWGGAQPGSMTEPVGNFSDAVGVGVNPMWPAVVSGYADGHDGPAPVMSYDLGVSPVGAFDMAGNVWEWVSDPYSEGGYTEEGEPVGLGRQYGRVIRGGGFSSPAVDIRTTVRYVAPPMGSYNTVGFRCAMDLPE